MTRWAQRTRASIRGGGRGGSHCAPVTGTAQSYRGRQPHHVSPFSRDTFRSGLGLTCRLRQTLGGAEASGGARPAAGRAVSPLGWVEQADGAGVLGGQGRACGAVMSLGTRARRRGVRPTRPSITVVTWKNRKCIFKKHGQVKEIDQIKPYLVIK